MKIKQTLKVLPAWLLTGITAVAVLWLTLSPAPLGDEQIELFPGADKVVHALMFGFLTFTILVDMARGRDFRKVGKSSILLSALVSTLLGIAIEYLQRYMELGRSFDTADMLADAIGSFTVAGIWLLAEMSRKT